VSYPTSGFSACASKTVFFHPRWAERFPCSSTPHAAAVVSAYRRRSHLCQRTTNALNCHSRCGRSGSTLQRLGRQPGAMRMVNKSEQKTINVGDLVQWASDGVDQFDTPRRVRGMQVHDQQEWAFVEGSETRMPVSELTVVISASAVMEEALSDPVASSLVSESFERSAASLSAQHAARTADSPLPTGAGAGRQTPHFTGIRVAPEKHASPTSSFTLVLAFALGAIASAAGIYAFHGMNPSLGPPPAQVAVEAAPVVPNAPVPTMERPGVAMNPSVGPPPAPVVAPVAPNAPVPAMGRPDQDKLNTSEIWEVQARLEFLGMQPGSLDGVPGYRTFNAIRRYEESRGQAQTGKLDRKLLERLREEPK